jgi:selenocysteine lyase/cysteine desulfurase
MARFLTENGASGRGAYAEARAAGRLIRQCRERIARLVNLADPDHVVFGYNTSDGLNLGVKGAMSHARASRGPAVPLHIVTTAMEHNSILRPLNALRAADPHLDVTFVPADAGGFVDPADIAKAIRPGQTVLVCLNHASNVTGAVQDLEAIGDLCARHGAGSGRAEGLLFLVDGAQSLGHWPVDMEAAHIDLLAFPGHKGLLGPTGTGGLCIHPGVEQRLSTIREGGTGTSSEDLAHPQTLPDKYESGSHNTVGIVGLSEGVAWLLDKGIAACRAHEVQLMTRFLAELQPDSSGRCTAAPGLRLLGPTTTDRRVGVFTFIHDELTAQEMAAMLEASYGILTRAGLHCAPLAHESLGTSPNSLDAQENHRSGGLRLSFGPFLQPEDIDYACAALAAICRDSVPASRR